MNNINSVSLRDYSNNQNVNFGKSEDKKSHKGLYLGLGAAAVVGGAVFRKQIKNTKLVNGATKRINNGLEKLAKKFPKVAKFYNNVTKKVSNASKSVSDFFSSKFPKITKWVSNAKNKVVKATDKFAENTVKFVKSVFTRKTFNKKDKAIIEKYLEDGKKTKNVFKMLEKHGLTKEQATEFKQAIIDNNITNIGKKIEIKEVLKDALKQKSPKDVVKKIKAMTESLSKI